MLFVVDTLSRCDLDLWPFDFELLQHVECHVFKLCTKLERNRITRGWVFDNVTRLRRPILGVCAPNSNDWRCRRHTMFVSNFRYLAAFPNADGSNSSDVENEAKFRTFCPPPVKIRGGVGKISGSVNEASPRPTTEPTFDGPPLNGCWERLLRPSDIGYIGLPVGLIRRSSGDNYYTLPPCVGKWGGNCRLFKIGVAARANDATNISDCN